MKIFSTSVLKEDFSEIEEYGLIQICDLSFSKAYSSLNSISKKKFKLKFRTSYSLFEYFIDYGYLNISNSWSYWNNNHDKFSCIYNTPDMLCHLSMANSKFNKKKEKVLEIKIFGTRPL